ncbi:MAG: YggT family protein [Chloroflexi bacterium]|nr:YggT family protein [Chloroflexota bacterium]
MTLIITLLNAIYYMIFFLFLARMIISFARIDPYDPTWGKIAQLVYQITEPMLMPIRKIIPPQGGLDLSPLILLVGIWILREILLGILI